MWIFMDGLAGIRKSQGKTKKKTQQQHISKLPFMPNEEETYDFNLQKKQPKKTTFIVNTHFRYTYIAAGFFRICAHKALLIINKMQFNIIFIDCK